MSNDNSDNLYNIDKTLNDSKHELINIQKEMGNIHSFTRDELREIKKEIGNIKDEAISIRKNIFWILTFLFFVLFMERGADYWNLFKSNWS